LIISIGGGHEGSRSVNAKQTPAESLAAAGKIVREIKLRGAIKIIAATDRTATSPGCRAHDGYDTASCHI